MAAPRTIAEIPERSAERFPERESFRFGSESLTYEELLEQSNGLASVLRRTGVASGDRVGIYMPKAIELPVAVYGILRAGAAYVPLDAAAPVTRLAAAVQDCSINCIVTTASHTHRTRELVAVAPSVRVVVGANLEEEQKTACIPWRDVPLGGDTPCNVSPSQLAYVMYTSGSTGKPKGIMHTHASGMAYAEAAATTYGVTELDRLGNHSPLHFDMSTFEMFAGPLAGAASVLIPEAYTKLPASLSKLIEAERLTFWYSVPYALIQLLTRGGLEERDLSPLRWILFGGEPFPPKHLRALMQQLPHARFSNVYGPAEVNQCTFFHVPSANCVNGRPAPIGQCWRAATALIVDEDDAVVRQGEVGELLVCTPTMMTGYWGDPEATAKSTVVRNDGGVEGRYYRTGDLVFENSDGLFEFVGRKDRQIKSRGYRIELDEVELVLGGVDGVKEAAAYPVNRDESTIFIESSVILDAGAALSSVEILGAVRRLLPAYALPNTIDIVTEFPRTGSGKIDRLALRRRAESGHRSS